MVKKAFQKENGVVLVIVLLILMGTSVLGVAAMAIVHTDTKITGNYRDAKAAFYAAEAGAERALDALRDDREWLENIPMSDLVNGSKYEVAASSIGYFRRRIISTGYYNQSVKKILLDINVDTVFFTAINAGGDLILVGKPRISTEGVRANGSIRLELDAGTPPLYVRIPSIDDVTLVSDCYGEGPMEGETEQAMNACGLYVTETPPMDFNKVRLEMGEWQELAEMAPEGHYHDTDGIFNSKDTEVTLNNFDCNNIEPDDDGKRTLFVDGNVTFTGELSGICTVVATGKIIGHGGYYTQNGTTVSMIAMDDVLLNYDTERQSTLNGLVYTEGDYELHGKIKFTGVVTAMGNVSAQNPSEFTNNSDPNYWYTYSSAYSVIADPIDIISWQEIYD